MVRISKEAIQELRSRTGVSVMAVKKVLEEAGGDMERALELLKGEANEMASKKAQRQTKAGIIQSYVHGGKIGVLVELRTETDFVAKNPEFQNFGREIAMQIAASDPADVAELLKTDYIRNPAVKVSDFLKEAIGKFGENIEVSRFARLEL